MATDTEVMVYAFLAGLLIIAACWVCYQSGKQVQKQNDLQERQAVLEHRKRQLREHGRIHDVREDATGAPATSRPITVLGASPRHRPPTRM